MEQLEFDGLLDGMERAAFRSAVHLRMRESWTEVSGGFNAADVVELSNFN